MALTTSQKEIITSTIPLLETYGLEITKLFYTNVLNDFPTLRSLFSLSAQVTDSQAKALAGAIHAYASNINDLTPILPTIERINQKHVSLDIIKPQYPIVGTNLIKALIQVLGRDVFTNQVEEAWKAAYQQLEDLMLGRENTIKATQEAETGGWNGWRKMKLVRKVVESSEITSFYWVPVDGKVLPTFKPGQYISIRVDVPIDLPGGQQIRQYTLSDAPQSQDQQHASSNGINGTTIQTNGNGDAASIGQYYRNSIKREESSDKTSPPGLVSNVLHKSHDVGSIVEMSQPAGDFFLESTSTSSSTAPLILISAGVGQTPLMSILNSLIPTSVSGDTTDRPVSWIHTARNKSTHAFAEYIDSLTSAHSNISSVIFHSQPLPDETQGTDYDFLGRLDLNLLDSKRHLHLNDSSAEYFICGPGKFMTSVGEWLRENGVDDKRVKMEVFGVSNIEQTQVKT